MILDTNLASRLSARLSAQDENQLLNHIWMGLLGVEALMVLGVALRAVATSRLFTAAAGAVTGSSSSSSRRNSMMVMKGSGLGSREMVVGGVPVVGEFYDGEGFWVRE